MVISWKLVFVLNSKQGSWPWWSRRKFTLVEKQMKFVIMRIIIQGFDARKQKQRCGTPILCSQTLELKCHQTELQCLHMQQEHQGLRQVVGGLKWDQICKNPALGINTGPDPHFSVCWFVGLFLLFFTFPKDYYFFLKKWILRGEKMGQRSIE